MKFKLFLPVMLALLLVGGVTFAAYGVGDTAADFTLTDYEGNPFTLYDYQGMVIVLNFWTST